MFFINAVKTAAGWAEQPEQAAYSKQARCFQARRKTPGTCFVLVSSPAKSLVDFDMWVKGM